MLFRTIVLLSILTTVMACAQGVRVQTKRAQPLRPDFTFLTNVQQAVVVGEPFTSSAPLVVRQKIEIDKKLEATTPHRNSQFHVSAASGMYELVGNDSNGQFYQNLSLVNVGKRKVVGGIYIPNNETTNAALYWNWRVSVSSDPKVYIADLGQVPSFKSCKIITPSSGQGFVATLTYAGIGDGQIKFVYREYFDDISRSAFTQEVSLDYIPESTFAYKSARFVVHNANNIQMTYTLLEPL